MANEISELLRESALLMVVGMTVVFVFLIILIGAVNLIGAICAKFPEARPDTFNGKPSPVKANGVSSSVVAAITAAIHQHRKG
ncbi:OadG family transporter subunit [Alteromonadaceae bacterium BrNp21-10]|nr:OadG family transporter subunit [Alteromonadaceae bacterium BrNp21-10]